MGSADEGAGGELMADLRVLRYRFGDARIRVHVPADLPTDLVRTVIPRYLAPEDEGPDHGSIMILRGSEGWSLVLPDGREARFEALGELLSFLEHGTTVAFLGLDRTCFHLHGAGTTVNGRALVVLGESGNGKTSMALYWSARRGLPTLGDDIVLLDPDGAVHPFRRLFRVSRDRAPIPFHVPEDSPLIDLSREGKLWLDPEWFAGWADPAFPALVAWVERADGADLRIRELGEAEALALLLGARFTLTGFEDPERHGAYLDACLRVCEAARILRVTFGDSHEAAEQLLSMLSNPVRCMS